MLVSTAPTLPRRPGWRRATAGMGQKRAIAVRDAGKNRAARTASRSSGRGRRLYHLAADHLFHFAGELLQAEGFREEVDLAVAVEALAEGVFGVARDENDLRVWMKFAHLADQRRPVHPRHHHIGDQEVDLFLGVADHLERAVAAFCLEHRV